MSLRGRKIPNIPTMNCNGGWFSKTYIIFGANLGQKMTQNSSGVAAFARWYFLEFFVGHKCNSSLFLNFIEKSRKIYWSHLCLFLRGNDFILFLAFSTILQFFFPLQWIFSRDNLVRTSSKKCTQMFLFIWVITREKIIKVNFVSCHLLFVHFRKFQSNVFILSLTVFLGFCSQRLFFLQLVRSMIFSQLKELYFPIF